MTKAWPAVLLAAALPPLALHADPVILGPILKTATLSHGKRSRRYRYYIPQHSGSEVLVPLVLVLSSRAGVNKLREITRNRFEALAEENGFILLYPESVGPVWNDGRNVPTYPSHKENVDDAGFLAALIDRFIDLHDADPRRVYIAGFSNGGRMTQRAACELPGKLAAIATVAGHMAANVASACRRRGPPSVLMIHGTNDPFQRWKDDHVRFGPETLGRVLPIPKNVLFWLKKNGCPSQPRRRWLPDADPKDGSRVQAYIYRPCRNNGEVLLYKVKGGGHTWPNGVQWQPEWAVGKTNRDLDASNVIWDFFKKHPGPKRRK